MMEATLYAALVPTFRQMLGSARGLLDKAEAFCTEGKRDPSAVIDARLAPDMYPFAYQIKSIMVHSVRAIEGAEAGTFSPDTTTPPDSFAGLKDLLAQADARLAELRPEQVDALTGRPMAFVVGKFRVEFTAENFLQSFSLPNFFFHVSMTYAILRHLGVDVGKRDYLGALRTAQTA